MNTQLFLKESYFGPDLKDGQRIGCVENHLRVEGATRLLFSEQDALKEQFGAQVVDERTPGIVTFGWVPASDRTEQLASCLNQYLLVREAQQKFLRALGI